MSVACSPNGDVTRSLTIHLLLPTLRIFLACIRMVSSLCSVRVGSMIIRHAFTLELESYHAGEAVKNT